MDTCNLLPDFTEDPARAAAEGHAIAMSTAIFSRPGEPNNANKMGHIRSQFEAAEATIFQMFPHEQVWEEGNFGQKQAASFLADLRCQYIKKVISDELIPPHVGLAFYISNRIQYVKMREQVNMFLVGQQKGDRRDH